MGRTSKRNNKKYQRKKRQQRAKIFRYLIASVLIIGIIGCLYMDLIKGPIEETHTVTDKWVEDEFFGPEYRIEYDNEYGETVTDVEYRNTHIGSKDVETIPTGWFMGAIALAAISAMYFFLIPMMEDWMKFKW